METVQPNGRVKIKKIRKQPPKEGLSPNDMKILKKFNKKAWSLDMLFSFCGVRLGWSAVIGIIPFIGDCINIYLSIQLVRMAQKIDGGLPVAIQSKMMANITLDFLLGITPVLGIVAGALYKSNSRNSLILEHYLRERAQANVKAGKYLMSDAAKSKGNGSKLSSWFKFGGQGASDGEEDIALDHSIDQQQLQQQQPLNAGPAASSSSVAAGGRVPSRNTGAIDSTLDTSIPGQFGDNKAYQQPNLVDHHSH